MKISIQELLYGKTEIMGKEIAIDVIRELIERKIPMTIRYYENNFDTLTQIEKNIVSPGNPRESKK